MVYHPAHPHPVVHWIKAEFDGAGGLAADLYQTYPRAYLTAHLDDGIMEAVTTNWGNDGIQIDMLGPGVAARLQAGVGPLQYIPFGDLLVLEGGVLNVDLSGVQSQITALQNQQLADEAAEAAEDAALAVRLGGDETNIATNTATIAALQAALAASNAQIANLQQQITVLTQTARYYPSAQALLAGTGALTASLRMLKLIAPTVLQGSGALFADGMVLRPIAANFAGAGGLTADLAGPRQIAAFMAATGGLSANLMLVKVAVANFAGTGGLLAQPQMHMPLAPITLPGTGALTANLTPIKLLAPITWPGAGALIGDVFVAQFVDPLTWAGEGQMLAAVQQLQSASSNLVGSGGIAINETMLLALQPGVLTGVGALTADLLQKSLSLSAMLAGAGALAAQANMQLAGRATLAGAGALTVGTLQKLLGNALFAGTGGLTAVATIPASGPAIDHAGSPTAISGSSPQTITGFTVGTGSSRALLVALEIFAASDISSGITLTWAGTSMTPIASYQFNSSDNTLLMFFALLNPASGGNNFVLSGTSGVTGDFIPISFTGVNQTAVTSAFTRFASTLGGTPASSFPISCTTTGTNQIMVAVGMSSKLSGSVTWTGSSPGTNWFTANGQPGYIGAYTPKTGTATTITFTTSGSMNVDTMGIVVNP